jgi:hypothetical protein
MLEQIPGWVLYPGIAIGALSATICCLAGVVLLCSEVYEHIVERRESQQREERRLQDLITRQVEGIGSMERYLADELPPLTAKERSWLADYGIAL